MSINELNFIRESNRIEGILREPTEAEIEEYVRFVNLSTVYLDDMVNFVKIYQPNAVIRDQPHLNVCVGNHVPERGGKNIVNRLEGLLDCCETADPYRTHLEYENLHPFTDGNGRSGRMLWAWQMAQHSYDFGLGFLHKFYYQTLNAQSKR